MDYVWIIEVDSFCAVIMGILLYSLFKNYDRQTKQRYYMRAIIAGIVSFLCDVNWGLIEGGFIPEPREANFLTNAVYEISSVMMGYYWLCYVETALDSRFIKTKYLKHIAKLPVIIIIGGVIASVYNGALFYIDTNNFYHRGDYIMLHVAMCQLYTIITSVHAFIKSLGCKVCLKAKEYKILSMFLIFPLVIGIIQIVVPAVPSVSVGVTLAFLFVYIDLQNLLISVDALTGLNNRNQLIRFLIPKLKAGADNDKLYAFMLNVNKFRNINNSYGHYEGDMALIRCANALKAVNDNTANFIGRYDSDKFIIIAELDDEEDAMRLCENVRQALIKECEKDGILYDLSFSFGFVKHTSEMKKMESFISAADKKLAEAKKEK
ncbi:GGDEF domain-containing protein [Treponema bryantii]|uniref:GGDEF domain-containing protein n=1 Tax=Treponema bryantii TaxID=163 RepID=UPI002B2D5892|nr:hypothetical protein TRBR_09650 [Treponema bryantii]